MFVSPGRAQSSAEGSHELDREHRRGVALAREGRHDEALQVLTALDRKYPGHYPVARDIVVITAWKGDCRATLGRHALLRAHPDPEPYYAIPVSECLVQVGRLDEAVALLDAAQARHPGDAALLVAYAGTRAKRDARLANELRLEAATSDSDQGLREWRWGARLDHRLGDAAGVHARYAASRSADSDLRAGNQTRLGLGFSWESPRNLVIAQEFSGDIHRGGQGGSVTSVVYLPRDAWRFGASHASFAEDLPLRARAQRIEARRDHVFAGFSSSDYRWSWHASTSRYDFTDGNRRSTLFTSLGHAHELKHRREQRVFFEYYRSDNTLANTVYYNPSRDRSVSVVHKTSFVRDTRFLRHVDHLYLSAGRYDQQGFPRHGTWGVRYEQDYDFTKRAALSFGISHGRRVYDGAAEFETSLSATFRWLF